jgi:hypothetical protein
MHALITDLFGTAISSIALCRHESIQYPLLFQLFSCFRRLVGFVLDLIA